MSTICADAVLKVADPEKNHLDLKDIQVISKGTGLNNFFLKNLVLPSIRLKVVLTNFLWPNWELGLSFWIRIILLIFKRKYNQPYQKLVAL